MLNLTNGTPVVLLRWTSSNRPRRNCSIGEVLPLTSVTWINLNFMFVIFGVTNVIQMVLKRLWKIYVITIIFETVGDFFLVSNKDRTGYI